MKELISYSCRDYYTRNIDLLVLKGDYIFPFKILITYIYVALWTTPIP